MKKIYEIKDKKVIQSLFDRAEYGTLALCEDNKPYSVPVNFVAIDDVIYFHGLKTGRKMDMILKNINISFSVVENYSLLPSYFSTDDGSACPATQFFKSVIIDGEAVVVENREEKAKMFEALMQKLQPEGQYKSFEDKSYDKVLNATAVIKIIPSEIRAKFKFGQQVDNELFNRIIEHLKKRANNLDLETVSLMEQYRAV